jgi:hypothetical protein
LGGQVTIQAIETYYAGCRFRSRLEARWAVFFDSAGVEWEYEAQGYELPSGACYLPDFWLPQLVLHAEVKGSEEALQAEGPRYAEAVFTSSIPGDALLFLGPVPDPDLGLPLHAAIVKGLTCCKVPSLELAVFSRWHRDEVASPKDAGDDFDTRMDGYTSIEWHPHGDEAPRLPKIWPIHQKRGRRGYLDIDPMPLEWPVPPVVRDSYLAARRARFEARK